MKLELSINGTFETEIIDPRTGDEISEREYSQVLEKLNSGEYVFGIAGRSIKALKDLHTVLYEVVLDPTNNLEYEWDEL